MSSDNPERVPSQRKSARWLILLSALIAACSAVVAIDPFGHAVSSAVYAWFAMSALWAAAAFILLRQQPILTKSTIVVIACFGILAHAFSAAPIGVLSGDVHRYQWDGRVINDGIDPYAYPPNADSLAPLHEAMGREKSLSLLTFNHLRTIYPPAAEYFFAISTAIAPYGLGWKLPTLLMIGASCWALVLLLRGMGRRPEGALAFVLSPVVLLHGTMDVHIDVVMTAFALWSLVVWRKGWWSAAGCLLGIAVGIKILPILLLPWMLRRTATKHRIALLLTMAATLVALYAPFFGPHVFESLADFSARFAANSLFGTTLVQILPVPLARVALLLLFVLFLALLWFRKVEPLRSMTSAFLFLLVFSPIVHPWYLIILVALGVLVPMRSVLVFGTTIAVSGVSILVYSKGGVWFEHPALLAFEYVSVLLALFIDVQRDAPSYDTRSVS